MQVIALLPMLAFASASAAAAQAPDQRSPEQLQALLQCRAIQDSGARLQCYDSAAEAFAQATETGAVVVVDRDAIRRTRRSLFGLSLPSLPFFGGDDSDAPSQIEAKISSVSPADYGKWLITLEDGAIWQTTEANTRLRDPRPGDTATIRKGTLGAYFVNWSGSRGVSAKRVR